MLFFFLESIPGCIFLVEYSWIVILLFIVLLTQTRDSLRTISPGCAPIPVSRDASPSRLLRSPSPGFCGMRTNFRIPGCVPIPMSRDTSPSRLLRSPSPGFCGSSSSLRSPSPGFCGMRTNFRIPGCVKISYLLSKMLQVIFIGINETRQGAQNKKKWSSFSAIGTSISSVHVS